MKDNETSDPKNEELVVEVDSLTSKLSEAEDEIKKLQIENKDLFAKLTISEDSLKGTTGEADSLKKKLSEVTEQVDSLQKDKEASSKDKHDLENFKEELKSTKDKLQSSQEEVKLLNKTLDEYKSCSEKLKSTHEQEITSLRQDLETRTSEMGDIITKVEALEKEILEKERNIKKLQDEMTQKTTNQSVEEPIIDTKPAVKTGKNKKKNKKKNGKPDNSTEVPVKDSEHLVVEQDSLQDDQEELKVLKEKHSNLEITDLQRFRLEKKDGVAMIHATLLETV